MFLLSEYNILEKISSKSNLPLYRAERYKDSTKVILKILENSQARSNETTRIINEYELAGSFIFKRIARFLQLEKYNNQLVAVLADIEGILLEEYLQKYPTNIENFLKIAIEIAEILEYFYQKDIVHQDLCPSHLIINPQTLEVSLIDFSIASQASDMNQTVEQPVYHNDSLSYISPEQTGRIKREILCRFILACR